MRAALTGVLGLLAFAGSTGLAGGQAGTDCRRLPSLDGKARDACSVDRAVEAIGRERGLRSLAFAVVEGGRVVHDRTFGSRSGQPVRPADGQTVFRGASLSKPVFAHVVMGLVRDGLIDLDRPLAAYLPKPLTDYTPYGDLVGDARVAAITARLVLSHRSGLPNWRWQSRDRKLRLQSAPGERFQYSGEAYQLLQFVIEQTTGKDLETLARETLFQPLGLARTSFAWRDDFVDNSALERETIERFFGAGFRSRPLAAGSLLTTAAEYGRFLGAVLSSELLPARVRDQMLEPQLALESLRMFGPPAPFAAASGSSQGIVWCLGWGGFASPAGPARFHVGYDSPEYDDFAVIYPEREFGLVVLTHGGSGPVSATPQIVSAIVGQSSTPFAWMGYGE
jgi:D-alanyl-D-alanine-carboxypeptidase/D-alanyl-D-alanine-endopeptidase